MRKQLKFEGMGVLLKKIRLEGSLGEEELTALFDSGASMSFIKRSIAQKLGHIEKLPKPLEFETAEKGRNIIAEERVILDFYIDGDRMSDEFLVLPDEVMSEDCIVGASTLQKWRLVLDFERETVYSARAVKKHMLKFYNIIIIKEDKNAWHNTHTYTQQR